MKVLLIDVSAVFWPAWYAGDGTNGVEARDATVRRCRKLAQQYDRAVICVDAGDSGRSRILEEYKANRPPKPAPAIEQLKRAIEYLTGDGFHVLKGDGYEADDTIATVCVWAQENDAIEQVVIACADKDLLQLVGGKVSAYSLTTDNFLTEEDVELKIGVAPEQVPDLLALVGDKADNIPGCPGVGPKTAAEYLAKYGTLGKVIEAAHAGEINGKRGQAVWESRDLCCKSRQLVELLTDSPIDPEIIMEEPKRNELPPPEENNEPPANEPIDVESTERPENPDDKPQSIVVRQAHAPVSFSRQLEPQSLAQAWHIAQGASKSRCFQNYPTPESLYLAIIAGRERGLGAVASLRGHFVFDGYLGMFTQLMIAEVIRSGKAEYFRPILSKCSETSATWETKRKGEDVHHEFTFTIEMAKRRGLTNRPNYQKQPDTMLRHRCAAELARAVYPDVVGGVYTEADIGDQLEQEMLRTA